MARALDLHLASSPRRNPLDNKREPRMGRLVAVPAAAAVLLAGVGFWAQESVQDQRAEAVAQAVIASGSRGPVEVESMRGEECWRAREGFRWRTAEASGWACAGPGGEVRLHPASHAAGRAWARP